MNLAEKSALVRYKTDEIGPRDVCDYVEDVGFEASLPTSAEKTNVDVCTIHIEGMTCNSCVQTIEGDFSCSV